MSKLNQMLVKEISDYEFVTLIYGVLDLVENTFTFANAGHPSAFRYDGQAGHVVDWISPTGPALGLFETADYRANCQKVSEGDKIVFFTDGLTGMLDDQGQEFGRERLREVIEQSGQQAPSDIVSAVETAYESHRGSREAMDDFSLLVAEIK
jgi:sigma-B regulation protein RsbU (phosphoserine phosphatase)